MRILLHTIRILVGCLFVVSGLVKVNDPIGTSIKMKEYFEVFAANFSAFFHALEPFSLSISIFLVVFEVVLGVALLWNYKPKLTLIPLLGLTLFFTLLTGYSAMTGQVTDCGCFGDALKLTPWQSFTKDIVLLALLLGLVLFHLPKTKPSTTSSPTGHVVVLGSLVVSLGLALYAVAHLPYIDFRAYKVHNHIPTQMKPSAPYVYEYVVEKDGQRFTLEDYPTDTAYKFIAMNHLNPEAAPKITDFAVWNHESDFTEQVFKDDKLFVVIYDVSKINKASVPKIKALIQALAPSIEVYALTASDGKRFQTFLSDYKLDIPYFYADATVLKTIVRSNPGLWQLHHGTVVGKWHYNDIPNADQVLRLAEEG